MSKCTSRDGTLARAGSVSSGSSRVCEQWQLGFGHQHHTYARRQASAGLQCYFRFGTITTSITTSITAGSRRTPPLHLLPRSCGGPAPPPLPPCLPAPLQSRLQGRGGWQSQSRQPAASTLWQSESQQLAAPCGRRQAVAGSSSGSTYSGRRSPQGRQSRCPGWCSERTGEKERMRSCVMCGAGAPAGPACDTVLALHHLHTCHLRLPRHGFSCRLPGSTAPGQTLWPPTKRHHLQVEGVHILGAPDRVGPPLHRNASRLVRQMHRQRGKDAIWACKEKQGPMRSRHRDGRRR